MSVHTFPSYNTYILHTINIWYNIIVSYASPPVQKLHPHGDIISKLYKPAFHGGHLSCNISYSSAAII